MKYSVCNNIEQPPKATKNEQKADFTGNESAGIAETAAAPVVFSKKPETIASTRAASIPITENTPENMVRIPLTRNAAITTEKSIIEPHTLNIAVIPSATELSNVRARENSLSIAGDGLVSRGLLLLLNNPINRTARAPIQ